MYSLLWSNDQFPTSNFHILVYFFPTSLSSYIGDSFLIWNLIKLFNQHKSFFPPSLTPFFLLSFLGTFGIILLWSCSHMEFYILSEFYSLHDSCMALADFHLFVCNAMSQNSKVKKKREWINVIKPVERSCQWHRKSSHYRERTYKEKGRHDIIKKPWLRVPKELICHQ